jgi:hypothetical protein
MAHWPRDRVDLVALTAQGVRKSGAQSYAPDEVRIGTDGKSYPATRAPRHQGETIAQRPLHPREVHQRAYRRLSRQASEIHNKTIAGILLVTWTTEPPAPQ